MNNSRRHDVDWLRVLALGLLIFFHAHLSFQSWASNILFIQNDEPFEHLWFTMKMLDIWRIPLLFLVSGMGVYFAMRNRDWKELLQERTQRILLPLIAGAFLICPISIFFSQLYYDQPISYEPNAGHLWFLANIFLYVLLLMPLFIYQKNNPDNGFTRIIDKILGYSWGLFLFPVPLMIETALVNPEHFSGYSTSLRGLPTAHGFWYGLVCFALGFLLVSRGDLFWRAVQRTRHGALAIASLLFLVRLLVYKLYEAPNILVAVESGFWLLAILGYGSLYLNKPSGLLSYLNKAVFPVYIVHLPLLFGLAYFLFPLNLPAIVKLVLLLAGTLTSSLLLYEIFRRLLWLRPLFGMPIRQSSA
ncbi:MAG: acyltransferase family protein [Pseudomonadota bacterium]